MFCVLFVYACMLLTIMLFASMLYLACSSNTHVRSWTLCSLHACCTSRTPPAHVWAPELHSLHTYAVSGLLLLHTCALLDLMLCAHVCAQVSVWRQAGEAWLTDLLQIVDLVSTANPGSGCAAQGIPALTTSRAARAQGMSEGTLKTECTFCGWSATVCGPC